MESRVHSKFKFQAPLTLVLKTQSKNCKFLIFKVIFELAKLVQNYFWLEKNVMLNLYLSLKKKQKDSYEFLLIKFTCTHAFIKIL